MEKKITLNSSDGEESQSQTIKRKIEDDSVDNSEKKITLNSSDGEESVALQSKKIKRKIEDDSVDNSSKKITVHCSDGKDFVVEKSVALQSKTIRQMIKDGVHEDTPSNHVTTKILSKVTDYCNKHVDSTASDDEIKTFDADFVKVHPDTLFALGRAAYYLNINSLVDLICEAVADMMKGKNMEDLAKFFNLREDYVYSEERIKKIREHLDKDPIPYLRIRKFIAISRRISVD